MFNFVKAQTQPIGVQSVVCVLFQMIWFCEHVNCNSSFYEVIILLDSPEILIYVLTYSASRECPEILWGMSGDSQEFIASLKAPFDITGEIGWELQIIWQIWDELTKA